MKSEDPTFALSTEPAEHVALDWAALRSAGIRRLERLAGHTWTDFNVHDPGITILEQLCYALTDLAYRASHDLPDLLAEDGSGSLYTPAQILASEPVTLLDLRKLVVDVEGVKNAWVEVLASPRPELFYHEGRRTLSLTPVDDTAEKIIIKGLYRVVVERAEGALLDGVGVERAVRRRLHAHRNICEDFAEVVVLDPQDVRVHAVVDIAAVADAEALLLACYRRISSYLSPEVRFQTLQEALASGRAVEEIFDGPPLGHGFLDDEDLLRSERRTTLHTSDVIKMLMEVPGVRAVRSIALASEGGAREAWTLGIAEDRVPRLALGEPDGSGRVNLTITLVRDQVAVGVDEHAVVRRHNEWLAGQARGEPLAAAERDLRPPRGTDRRVGEYRSIQREFPAMYGIGELGLADSATPERKAEAQQLRAYLTFYDAILAACFSQLAQARRLFGFEALGARSYFVEAFGDALLNVGDLWRAGEALSAEQRSPWDDGGERRGRFLDHLLARFGEALGDYSLVLFGAMRGAGGDADAVAVRERLLRDKEAFLRDLPAISGGRARGLDLLAGQGPGNVSGYAERLRRKLGLVAEDGEDLLVIEHILLRPTGDDREWPGEEVGERPPLLAEAGQRDPYSLQLSVVFPDAAPRLRHAPFRRFVEQTVRDETPAHLTVYVHWLAAARWDAVSAAFGRWLELRREGA